MKSTTSNPSKKKNNSHKVTVETSRPASKKIIDLSSAKQIEEVAVNELFLHFTANIIKEDTLFTR